MNADSLCTSMLFLLTRPSRGATKGGVYTLRWYPISTHTPLAGRDKSEAKDLKGHTISTHTPLAGRDCEEYAKNQELQNFYSHAPRGARRS